MSFGSRDGNYLWPQYESVVEQEPADIPSNLLRQVFEHHSYPLGDLQLPATDPTIAAAAVPVQADPGAQAVVVDPGAEADGEGDTG